MNKYFLLLISALLISCTSMNEDKGKITINNTSASPVSDVRIEYKNAGRVDAIGDLPAHSTYTYAITYTDAEDSLYIHYIDSHNQAHAKNVVAYAAKYDKEHHTFTIK
ncbi:hypothetical protein GCM10009129_05760 [Psychrobacter aestuarii]|uniref:Uncharacterized protein n=2 Tax=Psychrobacter aestuarii TaxID=556327 RepID=A0ABP3FCE3_9GAMM